MLNIPPITLPPLLYKYRPPERWAYRSLEDRSLRLTRPWEFNDLLDFRTPLSLDGLTDNDFERLRLHRPDIFVGAPQDKGGFVAHCNEKLEGWHTQFRENMRVICFSACNKIPRMWSCYGGRNRGFCLAFNPQKESIFKSTAKMTYREGTPSASEVVDMLLAKNLNKEAPYTGLLAYKSKKWEYEQEWRVLEHPMFSASRDTYYKWDALDAVYFGIETTQKTKQRILGILQDDKYRHVKIWEGEPDNGEHKIRFTPYS